MSVFGNIVVSLSWFGVNMLGVGLHSYGFMDQAFGTLMAFIGRQLVVMGLGLIRHVIGEGSERGQQRFGQSVR
jgi:hypothetical protein